MLDQTLIKLSSENFEKKIQGIFKKYGLEVIKLDKNKNGRRPDFFVFRKDDKNKGFICECKFIASAGTLNNGKYHISTLCPDLNNEGVFTYNSNFKIEEKIKNALVQYESLISEEPKYESFPFVVVIEADFFADSFDAIPRDIYGLSNISAVLQIKKNTERKASLKEWTIANLETQITTGRLEKKLPPESIRFKVLLNSKANIKFKVRDFLKKPII
ncbi:MAG: hypothetical protein KBG30_13295 [Bacteroidales bacterium]|nr:hypothetical protein [Bacteroidales bacterium]